MPPPVPLDPPTPLTPPTLEPLNTESATLDPLDPDTPPMAPAPEIPLMEDPEALFPEDENTEADDTLEPLVETDEALVEEAEADPLPFTA